MTREQKIAKARALRATGLTLREIGERLGISPNSVWGYCNPERLKAKRAHSNAKRGPQKRAWERAQIATCACGAPMGMASALPSHAPEMCRACRFKQLAAEKAERDDQIANLWKEGLTLREIANRLGSTKGSIGVSIHRMRQAGRVLPYRQRRSTPRFPDQVAA